MVSFLVSFVLVCTLPTCMYGNLPPSEQACVVERHVGWKRGVMGDGQRKHEIPVNFQTRWRHITPHHNKSDQPVMTPMKKTARIPIAGSHPAMNAKATLSGTSMIARERPDRTSVLS